MNGQWFGNYTGTNSGEVLVNVDDLGSHFRGVAYFTDSDTKLPNLGAVFRTKNKDTHFTFRTDRIWVIHPHTANATLWDDVKKLYDASVQIPGNADVTG